MSTKPVIPNTSTTGVDPIPKSPEPENPSPGPDESVFPKPNERPAPQTPAPISDRPR